MEYCSYKWLKKVRSIRARAALALTRRCNLTSAANARAQLVKIVRMRRLPRPAFTLASTTEVSIEFDEIDPDTGLPFEEIFSFSKVCGGAAAPPRTLQRSC